MTWFFFSHLQSLFSLRNFKNLSLSKNILVNVPENIAFFIHFSFHLIFSSLMQVYNSLESHVLPNYLHLFLTINSVAKASHIWSQLLPNIFCLIILCSFLGSWSFVLCVHDCSTMPYPWRQWFIVPFPLLFFLLFPPSKLSLML